MARERLQKILARAGYGSRRHNEGLIEAGRVRVNDKVAKLGDSAESSDTITVDGAKVKIAPIYYIMLNKPKGILSSIEDQRGDARATIRDFIDLKGHLYPVGRLDKQSEGLILMTNDGEMAHRLTHPRYEHEKTYQVWVTGQPSGRTLKQWSQGVILEDKKTLPADVQFVAEEGVVSQLRIVMREGRKRQIRRVANLMGHPVTRLIRKKIGPLHIGSLESGKWRHLTNEEVESLRKATKNIPSSQSKRGRGGANRPKRGGGSAKGRFSRSSSANRKSNSRSSGDGPIDRRRPSPNDRRNRNSDVSDDRRNGPANRRGRRG